MQPSPSPFARRVLQRHFADRMQKNPSYSLRAYARHLGLSPTVLSLVLSGKRALSRKALEKIAAKLELNPSEDELLQSELRARRKGSGALLDVAGAAEFRQLTLDQFAVISDWWHFAILSLIDIPGESLDPDQVGRRLNIHPIEAQAAIERLVRLGILEQEADGSWKQNGAPIKVENRLSTGATRKFNRQLLEKAIESLESDPIEKRDFSSVTFAMNPKLVSYALEKIRAFRRSLMKELENHGEAKEVYHLSVQIFPLTKESQS